MSKWRKKNMNIKEYIDSIDTKAYSKGIISIVLYDSIKDTHLYLFDFTFDEYGNKYCTMLNEPISKDLPYVELSTPFIDSLDEYYGSYSPIKECNDIGKHYKDVMKKLKKKEKRLES